MYDEAWAAVAALWDRAEALMGGACVLEPSFTAFRLSHRQGPQGKYVGTNFGAPPPPSRSGALRERARPSRRHTRALRPAAASTERGRRGVLALGARAPATREAMHKGGYEAVREVRDVLQTACGPSSSSSSASSSPSLAPSIIPSQAPSASPTAFSSALLCGDHGVACR